MTADFDINSAGSVVESCAALVALMEPVARFALRAGEGDQGTLSIALNLELPLRIGQISRAGTREVLCLGPDEWLLHCQEDETDAVVEPCAKVYENAPHSLTEITDREVTLAITGDRASELLTLGLPRDIDSLPEREARRTIFDGVTVVLWRDGISDFRMDVWRSFTPHVLSLLATGCAELASE